MFRCSKCNRMYMGGLTQHSCADVIISNFVKWLDGGLSEAVESFRRSPVFQFELFYETWRTRTNTHQLR